MQFDAKIFLKKNAPIILSVISVGGLIGTVITAVKAAPKAERLLKEKEEEKGEPLTVLEKVKCAGGVYIPTILTGTVTAACIISGGVLNKKQANTLSAAYALLASQYEKYKYKVRELYGEEAHREIMRQIELTPCEPMVLTAQGCFCNTGFDLPDDRQKRLFYDAIGQLYFESTYEDVLQALYHFNRNFAIGGYGAVDTYHEFLGLRDYPKSQLGWYVEDELYFIDFGIYKTVTDDGLEYYMIDPMFWPYDEKDTQRYYSGTL